MIEAIQQN